jgi:hypothetical protein
MQTKTRAWQRAEWWVKKGAKLVAQTGKNYQAGKSDTLEGTA